VTRETVTVVWSCKRLDKTRILNKALELKEREWWMTQNKLVQPSAGRQKKLLVINQQGRIVGRQRGEAFHALVRR
jgi:hypothetical protein